MKKIVVLIAGIFMLIITTKAQNVGIGVTSPSDKLHINTVTGDDPLRVQINSSTKFRVNSNGGTTIGGGTTIPPVNGLFVEGSIQPQSGIETNNKLIVESTGDSIIMKAGGSVIILASNGNITIKATTGKIVIEAATDLELKGNNIRLQATSSIYLTGSSIRMNGGTKPIARIGDMVNAANQIITGSNTVFAD